MFSLLGAESVQPLLSFIDLQQTRQCAMGELVVPYVKDPVLHMILSGLTMNFMLYEKDYGLDRKALLSFQPSTESCEVIALTSQLKQKTFPKVIEEFHAV